MPKRGIDKKRYKKDLYYKYLLKTGAFLKKTGVTVSGRWLYFSIIIGVVSALGASVFMVLLNFFKEIMLAGAVGYSGNETQPIIFMPGAKKWMLLIIPAAGAFLAGIIAHKFAPDAQGHGTGNVIKSFHRENGNIPV